VGWSPQGTSFITSDNPFVVVPPQNFSGELEGYGILTPGATTVLPLTRSTCVYFRGKGGHINYGVAPEDFVHDVNCYVAANSDRFVIAQDKAMLQNVVCKTKVGEWRNGPRVQFNAPDPYSHVRPSSGKNE
jgi:hypothetical protein